MDARTRDGLRGLADALAGYREGACEECGARIEVTSDADR